MQDTLVWEVPLESPPEIVNIGRNAHGYEPSDRYRLKDLWSLHLYGYHAALRLDGHEFAVRPGTIGINPPGTLMETRYTGISVHLFAHFKLPPATEGGATRRVPALQDLGERHDATYARFYECVGLFSREPRRVQARVWDLLWEVATLSPRAAAHDAPGHAAVRLARDVIERHLSEPISVTEIAAYARVSPSYLARLFKEEFGDTVVGYIRRRRLLRANYLLQRSTLPIKEIAISVGIADLQHFNKAMRAEYGMGPREWRRSGPRAPESSEIDQW